MNIETIKSLKERAKEMLNGNFKRIIDAEEIYTIICEWEQEKEKNNRNKAMLLKRLDKLKYSIENDFPLSIKKQPLWDEHYVQYVDKSKIEEKIKEYEKKLNNTSFVLDSEYYGLISKIQVLKQLLEE